MNNYYSNCVNRTKNSSPVLFSISFVITLSAIIYLILDFEKNNTQCNFIIKGLKFSSEEQIDSILGHTSQKYKSKLEIIKSVESLPYVESCNIFTLNAETLIVDVKEKIPVGKLVDSSGETYFLDNSGYVYKIPNVKNTLKVPLIKSPPKKIPEIIMLINSLSRMQRDVLNFVDEISNYGDNYLLYCKSSRTKILLPKKHFFESLSNVADMFEKVESSKILNASLIDLRLNDRIIVK